jgi:3',5'-cyclic AMP phosphodiesterase CpdA
MLVAQITDVHLGFEQGNPDELNRRRLDATLAALAALDPRPDLLLATGDIADAGDDPVAYAAFVEATSGLPFPVFPALGNHDGRSAFAAAFPELPRPDGFCQYEIDRGPLRILVLDTLEEGRHGGAFCETRAAWLEARLAEAPERPTLIVVHHPPVDSGLSWMGENPDSAWMARLEAAVASHDNVVAAIAGHLHRPLVTRWAGTVLAVCPSTAPQVALDLGEMDSERPDGRPMIVADPPVFGLHLWDGRRLVSHFDTADAHEVLARFTPQLQPLVRMLKKERENP